MSANSPAGEPGPRATLAEVAALADVSISTVSKVLNGRNGVSEKIQGSGRVAAAGPPVQPAQPGSESRPADRGAVFRDRQLWATEAIAAIERVAREHGVGLVVSGTNDRHKPDLAWIEGVINRRPVGVILIVANLLEAQRSSFIPATFPSSRWIPAGQPRSDAPSIGSADWSGAYAATKHLVELGHREIAIITGPDDMMASIARLSGFTRPSTPRAFRCPGKRASGRVPPRRRGHRGARAPRRPGRRRRFSRPPTSRRSASTSRHEPSGSRSPRSCRSSASTTSRSPDGRDRR